MSWRCEGLFSEHFLAHRLPQTADYPTREDAESLLGHLKAIHKLGAALYKSNEEDTEKRLVTPLLERLGYGVQNRRQIPGNRDLPDYLLYPNPEDAEDAFASKEFYARIVGILEAKRYGRNLSEKGKDGKKTPHGQIRDYLNDARVSWGILTNGAKWRLYARDDRPSSYFEFDLQRAYEADDLEELRLFLALFGAPALTPDASKVRPIDRIREGSVRFREEIEKKLRQQVFDGVERLAQGFLAHPDNDVGPDSLKEVYENGLVLLYRLLFVLNAEARDLLPTERRNAEARKYIERYGLEAVREKLLDPVRRDEYRDEATTGLYSRMRDLFRLVNGRPAGPGKPDPNAELGIPRYNGGLFDPAKYPFLEGHVVGDAALADVLARLMFRQEGPDAVSFDYANLGERHLGSIYEGLLEHRLVWDAEALRPTLRNDKGERKTSGAYYTPESLVRYLVRESLTPLLDRCEASLVGYAVRRDPDEGILPADGEREVEPDDRFAEAVLRLNVCDPAMGSGHFLVEAVELLAETVAGHPTTRVRPVLNLDLTPRLKTDGSGEPLETYEATLAYWKRRIVEACLYGVDLNPLAVELAKLSLWLKTVDRVPLNFLDHHLRCGNALLGVPLKALGRFVNPAKPGKLDWTKPVQLDFDLQQSLEEAMREAIAGIAAIESTETDTHATAKAKEARWRDLAERVLPPFRAVADLWIAPWLGATTGYIEFERAVRDPEGAVALREGAAGVLDAARPFHWELEFPDVFFAKDGAPRADGGFDAVVGNPPWERIKLQENEFFAARAPEVARAPRASDRKAAIARLRTERPELWDEYVVAKSVADRTVYFLQKSAFFPLMGRGDTNLYSVFAERALGLLAPHGRLGLLVPSGIASDAGSAPFFGGLAGTGRLAGLVDFENRNAIFEDVHRSFKFCAFLATGPDAPASVARCGFFLHDPAELKDPERLFPLTPADFRLFNPNTGNSPVFRSRRDAELTRRIYARVPILWRRPRVEGTKQVHEANPWGLSFLRMFDMTNDSKLFRTAAELEGEGFWPSAGWIYTKGKTRYLPLYESKMIHQYDHRYAEGVASEERLQSTQASEVVASVTKGDPSFSVKPRYWVPAQSIDAMPAVTIGFRDIARATDVRTTIATVLPPAGAGNNLPLITTTASARLAACLLGNLNSIVSDYVARQKVMSTHLNFFIVEQLPVLPPEAYVSVLPGGGGIPLGDLVVARVLELSYTAHDLKPFADALGYDGPPFAWDEERRLHLKAQLDALFFLAYGLDRDDAEYVLSTFPIVRRADEARYAGRFRTRDLILHYMAAYAAGDTDAWVSA